MSRVPLVEVVVVLFHSVATAEPELTKMIALGGRSDVGWTFVDNSVGGTDAGWLRPRVRAQDGVGVVTLPNPGFAAACNVAAQRSDSPWLFFLNPDVTVDGSDLDAIVAFATQLGERACTGAVSQDTNGFVHAGVSLRGFDWFTDRPVELEAPPVGPSGGAGLYPRETFVAMGGFFEPLFAWGEDADLALRLRSAGVPCEVLDLRLAHTGGHTVASRTGARLKARLLTRNRLVVAYRTSPLPRFLLFVLYDALVLAALTPRNLTRRTVGPAWRGYLAGLAEILRTGRRLRLTPPLTKDSSA